VRITALILVLSWPACLRAAYTASEILVIPWGEGPNELEIAEPYLVYDDTPGADTTGYPAATGGPSKPFVDREENFYFISYHISYLKGFNSEGEVIVDYSEGKTEFRDEFFRGIFLDFYVDSLGRIFCNGNDVDGGYVAVADRNNNLLDKLNPLGVGSGVPCSFICWGSDDVLIFQSRNHGYSTYMNGEFYPGGAGGWRAKDGVYYFGMPADASTIQVFRYENPDTTGQPSSMDTLYFPQEIENLRSGGLVGMDDEMNFYLGYKDSTGSRHGIRVYNQNQEFIDELEYLPREENKYLWDTPNPFLRHDGNIYEFHCRDDGMHIFRWSRE
jgi:hypothetical protein